MSADQNELLLTCQLLQLSKVMSVEFRHNFIFVIICLIYYRLGSNSNDWFAVAKGRLSRPNNQRHSRLHQTNALYIAGNSNVLHRISRISRSIPCIWHYNMQISVLTNAMISHVSAAMMVIPEVASSTNCGKNYAFHHSFFFDSKTPPKN